MTPPEEPRKTALERHVQSILLSIVTAAVLYGGKFVVDQREQAARIETQIGMLLGEVNGARAQMADLRDHEYRLRALEREPNMKTGATVRPQDRH
jgi:hypothetical protein